MRFPALQAFCLSLLCVLISFFSYFLFSDLLADVYCFRSSLATQSLCPLLLYFRILRRLSIDFDAAGLSCNKNFLATFLERSQRLYTRFWLVFMIDGLINHLKAMKLTYHFLLVLHSQTLTVQMSPDTPQTRLPLSAFFSNLDIESQ